MLAVPEKVGMRCFGIHIGTERILIYEGEKKYFLDSNLIKKFFIELYRFKDIEKLI